MVDLIQWTFDQKRPTIVTTSFGNHSAVLIHMVKEINPQANFVWIDTQFNTTETLNYKNALIRRFNITVHSYVGETWDDEIPLVNTLQHSKFVEQIKLEPFRQAVAQLTPAFWITGVRGEQTEYRKHMRQIDQDNGITKISPLLYWSTERMEEYLKTYGLPNETNYFDPTKVSGHECGLHTINLEQESLLVGP